ncbi:MAG TPA: BON domain-containing protein [Caldisericia bacterium]|nr:BON domain-containing protein [Caldisericia bacterium]HQL66477.1 BON domain-containing protein [Caldisericia bacterium]HQN48224.1 BON domain-containing protein [Caldisericia bacterium]HQO99567.1 BON domain-containing protein [Caldisericia bacterium]
MDRRIVPSKEKNVDVMVLKKIKDLINKDNDLKNENINFTVSNREIFIKGEVTKKENIEKVEKILKSIKNIKKINNNLTLSIKRITEDNDLETVAYDILKERNLNNININVKNGVLNIYGKTETLKEKREIEKIFSSLNVSKINNFIKIVPNFSVNDFMLQSLSKDKLKKMNIFHLRTRVLNKVLYLKGNVETKEEKEKAYEMASDIPGVVDIINGIVTRDEKSIDVEIENKISEILKDPSYQNDRISFISIDGTVFLEGEATNPNSLYSVEEKVGKIKNVKKVINQILGVIK